MSICKIIFSPTGNTEKAADMVCRAFGGAEIRVDLMDRNESGAHIFCESDICVVAMPAFVGRVPALAAEKMARLQGNGAKAILMAVYGNRAIEDTLVEMQDILEKAGFACVAGMSVVAEHSIMRQFAHGRPDEKDAAVLEGFGAQVRAKLEKSDLSVPALPGNRPYRDYSGVIMKPQAGEKCDQCGACAAKCPVEAIPAERPSETNTDICISCMGCIAVCPKQARLVDPAVLEAPIARLTPICGVFKENELYI